MLCIDTLNLNIIRHVTQKLRFLLNMDTDMFFSHNIRTLHKLDKEK